jgi:hypothetical protein
MPDAPGGWSSAFAHHHTPIRGRMCVHAYLQRRMTLTFTPSSGVLALASAMASREFAKLPLSRPLVGDLLGDP